MIVASTDVKIFRKAKGELNMELFGVEFFVGNTRQETIRKNFDCLCPYTLKLILSDTANCLLSHQH